jgi:hypothetical protein
MKDPKKSPIFLNEEKKHRARRIGSAKLKERTLMTKNITMTLKHTKKRESVCV